MTEDRLRAGRLSNEERDIILDRLGEEASKRYNENIIFNSQGYNLRLLLDGLQWKKDIRRFRNDYYVNTGDQELNRISAFFEYGTGIHNTEYRNSEFIKPKGGKYLKFVGTKKYAGVLIFTKKVKGVRPIMMFQRTIQSMEDDRDFLQRQIRMEMGI